LKTSQLTFISPDNIPNVDSNDKEEGNLDISNTNPPIPTSTTIKKQPEPSQPILRFPSQTKPQATSSSPLSSHWGRQNNAQPSTRRHKVKIQNLSQLCPQPDLCTDAEKHNDQVLVCFLANFNLHGQ
jgi:hypothetical protein